MIDTSAMLAALVGDHEHHGLARGHLRADGAIAAIVLAETYAQLRRTFGQRSGTARTLLRPWTENPARVLATSSTAVEAVFARCVELDLGGNIHDALIAQVCSEHGVELVTLDARQHRVALALGTTSTYLLG